MRRIYILVLSFAVLTENSAFAFTFKFATCGGYLAAFAASEEDLHQTQQAHRLTTELAQKFEGIKPDFSKRFNGTFSPRNSSSQDLSAVSAILLQLTSDLGMKVHSEKRLALMTEWQSLQNDKTGDYNQRREREVQADKIFQQLKYAFSGRDDQILASTVKQGRREISGLLETQKVMANLIQESVSQDVRNEIVGFAPTVALFVMTGLGPMFMRYMAAGALVIHAGFLNNALMIPLKADYSVKSRQKKVDEFLNGRDTKAWFVESRTFGISQDFLGLLQGGDVEKLSQSEIVHQLKNKRSKKKYIDIEVDTVMFFTRADKEPVAVVVVKKLDPI